MANLNSWRTFSIFISSTFKDMQAERDYLKNYVMPRLEQEYAQHRVAFKVIDLRWGVNTLNTDENEREAKVLKVCLDSVSNNRPFFIALLGDRYGWIPPKEKLANVCNVLPKKEKDLLIGVDGKSVTELEILFGAIGSPKEILSRSLFFFRSPDSYKGMDEDQLKPYFDEGDDKPEKVIKLALLKENIQTVCAANNYNEAVHEYTLSWQGKEFGKLEEWGDLLYNNICREINEEIKVTKDSLPKDWYEQEERTLNEFVYHRTQRFVGRKKLLSDSESFLLNRDEAKILTAFSGAGKSAFMCKLYENLTLKSNNRIVLFHSAGISPYSVSVYNMLERWSKQLADTLSVPYIDYRELQKTKEQVNEIDQEKKDISEQIKEQFLSLVALAKRNGDKLIILLDALDRLSKETMAEYMQWLPNNCAVLVTAIPGYEKSPKSLHSTIQIEDMPLFEEEDARAMITEVCRFYGKDLYDSVIDIVLTKTNDQGQAAHASPLWLSLVTNILFGLNTDDFQEIRLRNEATEEQKIIAFFEQLADGFSPYADKLFLDLLRRASKLFGEELTMQSMKYISLARHGLREKDLAALLGDDWDELMFLSLQRWFKHLLTETDDKKWTFAHIKLNEALIKTEEEKNKELHRNITVLLEKYHKIDNLRETEIMYHIIKGEMSEWIPQVYVNFNDKTRHYAEDTILQLFKEDESILYILAHAAGYEENQKIVVQYAAYLINLFGKKIAFKYPEQYINMGKVLFYYIDIESKIIKHISWIGIIAHDLSTACDNARKQDDLKFFAEIQFNCYQKCVEELSNDFEIEVYKNNLAMAFFKLGSYYSSQGDSRMANECYDKITLI